MSTVTTMSLSATGSKKAPKADVLSCKRARVIGAMARGAEARGAVALLQARSPHPSTH